MPATRKVKRVRDVTLALSYATLIQAHAEDGEYSPEINAALVDLLRNMNAATGRRDKGKGPALTPVRRRAKR